MTEGITTIDEHGEIIEIDIQGIMPPLNANEKKRLKDLEGIITRNFGTFIQVGCALKEIHENRLYRKEGLTLAHYTFPEYCREKWDVAGRTAYQLIGAAEVVENVRNCAQISQIPANEAQARPLVGLSPEEQVSAWIQAVETAPEGKVTASHVKGWVKRIKGEPVKKAVQKSTSPSRKGMMMSEPFEAQFDAFLAEINREALSGWETTDREQVAKLLRVVLAAVEGYQE